MGDYSGLKRLAEAATPGEWLRSDDNDVQVSEEGDEAYSSWEIAGPATIEGYGAQAQADADFIAAANPADVLALVAENERLVMMRSIDAQTISRHQGQIAELIGEGVHLKAEIEALRTALCKIMTQIDGNIRVTVRDCVNGHDDVQDIYGYCDAIESLVDAAMGMGAGHD
jgi:hypothetical protein